MAPKQPQWRTAAIGSALQLFEMTTLGICFDNLKTVMAANRGDNLRTAVQKLYARGGLGAFWRGLIPWAWIEASTKGGVLLFTQTAVTNHSISQFDMSNELASGLGGVIGGVCQAYTTMGFCTFMRTVEITRVKRAESTLAVAAKIFRKEGIRGMYKGVNAVALRQATNWGSRFGFSRVIESVLRGNDKERKLTKLERLSSSAVGGGLACWNQPLEVIRVEMQLPREGVVQKRLSISEAAKRIYAQDGVRGFYRGVTPRVGLSVYLTVVMVFGGDEVKQYFASR